MSERYVMPHTMNAALTIESWPLSQDEAAIHLDDGGQIVMTHIVSAGLSKTAAAVAWLKNRASDAVPPGLEYYDYQAYRALGEQEVADILLKATASGQHDVFKLLTRRSTLWLEDNGLDPNSLNISYSEAQQMEASPYHEPTQDVALVRPHTRLFGVADGASPHGDGAKVGQFVVDEFGDSAKPPNSDEIPLHSTLNEGQQRLWAGSNGAEWRLRNAKGASEIGPGAYAVLVAGHLGEAGLSLFNAGNARSLLTNHATLRADAFTSEQSNGVELSNIDPDLRRHNDRPTNRFSGVNRGKRHYRTRPTVDTELRLVNYGYQKDPRAYCPDELLAVEWDKVLQPGGTATLGFFTDGITGNIGTEVVDLATLAQVTNKYRHDPALGARVMVSRVAQKIDHRQYVGVSFERR